MSCSRTVRSGQRFVLSFQHAIYPFHQLLVSLIVSLVEFTHVPMVCIYWLRVFVTQFQKRGLFLNNLIEQSVTKPEEPRPLELTRLENILIGLVS